MIDFEIVKIYLFSVIGAAVLSAIGAFILYKFEFWWRDRHNKD
jgi:hypothetical protein